MADMDSVETHLMIIKTWASFALEKDINFFEPAHFRDVVQWVGDALALLKEQEKLVDVDALREKLGLAKDCAKCKQNTRTCQYDSHFSLMDFCERLDMAIEELLTEGR